MMYFLSRLWRGEEMGDSVGDEDGGDGGDDFHSSEEKNMGLSVDCFFRKRVSLSNSDWMVSRFMTVKVPALVRSQLAR